jgi:methylmalonyl-CoA mutase, N-terminal domain
MEILARIEEIGLIEAVTNGTIEAMMDAHNVEFQHELDREERILVGVNKYVPDDDPAPTRFKFDRANTALHLQRFADLKRQRDQTAWAASLKTLHGIARDGNNPMQAMIDAFIADASIGEIWGTVRVAHGYAYDPYEHIVAPLDFA